MTQDGLRRKQLAYLDYVKEETGWNQTDLARKIGKDPSTLSKFKSARTLHLDQATIEAIHAKTGIEPYRTKAVERPRGFAEEEVARFDEATEGDQQLLDVLRQVVGRGNAREPWVLKSDALLFAGYLAGDIIIVDLGARPVPGDVVLVSITSRGDTESVARIFEPPFVVAATPDKTLMRPLLIDDANVVIRGPAVASLRPRRIAS